MADSTHVVTTNGEFTGELLDIFRSHRDQIARSIGLLDGSDHFAFKLAALPAGQRWSDVLNTWNPPTEYIQCAGSADAVAIEARIVGEDGVARQYAIGRGRRSHRGTERADPVRRPRSDSLYRRGLRQG